VDNLAHLHLVEAAEQHEAATKRIEKVFAGCSGDCAQGDKDCRHPYYCLQRRTQPVKRSLWQRVKAWFVGDEILE
jgi:hypothetical protein